MGAPVVGIWRQNRNCLQCFYFRTYVVNAYVRELSMVFKPPPPPPIRRFSGTKRPFWRFCPSKTRIDLQAQKELESGQGVYKREIRWIFRKKLLEGPKLVFRKVTGPNVKPHFSQEQICGTKRRFWRFCPSETRIDLQAQKELESGQGVYKREMIWFFRKNY